MGTSEGARRAQFAKGGIGRRPKGAVCEGGHRNAPEGRSLRRRGHRKAPEGRSLRRASEGARRAQFAKGIGTRPKGAVCEGGHRNAKNQ